MGNDTVPVSMMTCVTQPQRAWRTGSHWAEVAGCCSVTTSLCLMPWVTQTFQRPLDPSVSGLEV